MPNALRQTEERPDTLTDEELMPLVARGDARAFAILVERHRGRAMRMAFGVVRNRSEAEDCVQEAFMRVWSKARDWDAREGARFSAWLARITINLAIDGKRKMREDPLDDMMPLPDDSVGADDRVHGQEIAAHIAKALEHLPERQRIAFALCQIDRMSNGEAASALGVTVGALELLLVRARKTVRLELADLIEAVQ